MKIKTAELTGPSLDWAVAKCEGFEVEILKAPALLQIYKGNSRFRPSADWAQGGPIIERERIAIQGDGDGGWQAGDWFQFSGPTPLTAAMRCYVGSKLGAEVEIPEEVL